MPSDVYLINRLPTSHLDNQSPYQRLLRKSPNYNSLRIFGCLCYPWLKPYSKNKLESKSTPCVYLGFSLSHHCHQCFDPISAKVYLSRDVRFVEDVFPFKTLFSNIAIKSTHLEWATPTMPSSSDPTPKLPIVTNLPTPSEIAAHTITDFPSPSASSPAQSGDNSNSLSLSNDASVADATDSPLATPPSQGKFLSSSSSIIPASQNTSSISTAQRLALPRLPTNSQKPIPTNT